MCIKIKGKLLFISGPIHNCFLIFTIIANRECSFFPLSAGTNKTWVYFGHFKMQHLNVLPYFKYLETREGVFSKEEIEFYNNNMEITKTIFSEPYQVIQFLTKPSELPKADCLSFIFQNLSLLLMIVVGYLCLIILVHLFFLYFSYRFRRWKKIKINAMQYLNLTLTEKRFLSPKIAFFYLFYSIFLFIILFLLTTSIKSDTVVINTDEFINSNAKFTETNATLVYNKLDNHLFINAPKGTIFFDYDLKEAKSRKRSRLLDQEFVKITNAINFDDYFFFGRSNQLLSSSAYLSKVFNPNNEYFIFLTRTIYYENLNAVLMLKSLETSKKRMINFRCAFEIGY